MDGTSSYGGVHVIICYAVLLHRVSMQVRCDLKH